MSMGWDHVSELRPPTGLLFIPQMMYEYGDPRWNDIDRGKPKNSEKTCPSTTLSLQIPHGLTRASAEIGRRLTAWAIGVMALVGKILTVYFYWLHAYAWNIFSAVLPEAHTNVNFTENISIIKYESGTCIWDLNLLRLKHFALCIEFNSGSKGSKNNAPARCEFDTSAPCYSMLAFISGSICR
jgi:hypothetical protein